VKFLLAFAAGAFALILPTGAPPRPLEHPGLYTFNYENILGTSMELKIGASSLPKAEAAEAKALNEIDRLSKILSTWDNDSEVSRWEKTFGQPVHVSPELFEVLSLFDRWRNRTGGALDPSAEVITRSWKQAERDGRLPSPEERAAALRLVQQPHWRLNREEHTATHLSTAPLVLSSFTKSYIAGRAADAVLATGNAESVVVNIGGDLVVRGAWSEPVDIANPKADAENDPPIAELAVRDRTVATSGNYRRGVAIGGAHYSHIVDPRTGMPCEKVLSSTVIAVDPADAGAMATAFSVLSPDESSKVAAAVPGTEFFLVMNDGRRITSPGWGALLAAAPQAPQSHARPGGPGLWDPSFELVIGVELARLDARARRPYMAVWIEDKDKFPVRTVALWYNKDEFLHELRAWYRDDKLRSMAGGPDISHSVSSATRPAGKYTLKWDGKDDAGKYVRPGRFTVFLEAVREHGGYDLLHQEMDFSGVPKTAQMNGSSEVVAVSFDYKKTTAP
jgi:FAD:protein FMN transferase